MSKRIEFPKSHRFPWYRLAIAVVIVTALGRCVWGDP